MNARRPATPRRGTLLGGFLALALVLVAPLTATPAAAAVGDDAVGAVVRDQNLIAASAGGLGIGMTPAVYYQAFTVAVTGTLTTIAARGTGWSGTPTLEVKQLVNGVPLGTTLATSVGATGDDIKSFDLGAGLAVTAGDTLGFKVTANADTFISVTNESYAPGSLYYGSVPYSYPLPIQFATYVQQAAPGSVTALGAAVGDRSSTVSWSAPTGVPAATHYQIDYRETGSTVWTSSGSTATTSGTVTGLTGGTEYDVAVRSVDAAGGVSARSIVTVTPVATATAPVELTALVSDSKVDVSWKTPTDVGTSPVLGYTLQVFDTADGTLLATSTDLSAATDRSMDAPNGEQLDYRVFARTAAGNGAVAAVAATASALPEAPAVTSISESDNAAAFNWDVPVSDGSAIQSYQVELAHNGVTTVTDVATTTYSVPGAANGESYGLRVRAVNAAGAGNWSSSVLVVPRTVPDAPMNLAAIPGNASATLSWNAPANTGGAPILGYTIGYRTIGAPTWIDIDVTGASAVVGSLVNGSSYEFRVAGENAAGSGAYSATISASPFTADVQFEGADGRLVPGARLMPGAPVVITASDLPEGAEVTFELRSTPVVLGTVTVGPDGSARIAGSIPLGAVSGMHNLVVTVASGGGIEAAMLAVEVVPAPSAVVGSLVVTGTDAGRSAAVALLVIAAGTALLVYRRRRLLAL